MNLAVLRGDMSVLELSRRSGVARNTIAALERGEATSPSPCFRASSHGSPADSTSDTSFCASRSSHNRW